MGYCWCSSQLLQDFSNHCRKINSKVMNIMDELITKQLAKVQRVYQPRVLGPSFSIVQLTVYHVTSPQSIALFVPKLLPSSLHIT